MEESCSFRRIRASLALPVEDSTRFPVFALQQGHLEGIEIERQDAKLSSVPWTERRKASFE